MFTALCAEGLGVHLEPERPLEGPLVWGAQGLRRGPLEQASTSVDAGDCGLGVVLRNSGGVDVAM